MPNALSLELCKKSAPRPGCLNVYLTAQDRSQRPMHRPVMLRSSSLSFLNRQLGSLKSNLAMSSVTKWLAHRAAAAAQGKSGFAGQVVLVAVGIHQLDGA